MAVIVRALHGAIWLTSRLWLTNRLLRVCIARTIHKLLLRRNSSREFALQRNRLIVQRNNTALNRRLLWPSNSTIRLWASALAWRHLASSSMARTLALVHRLDLWAIRHLRRGWALLRHKLALGRIFMATPPMLRVCIKVLATTLPIHL